MFAPTLELLTIPVLAQQLGVPAHRIQYIIMARRIPWRRAGNVRVFDEAAKETIARELAGIDERRAGS